MTHGSGTIGKLQSLIFGRWRRGQVSREDLFIGEVLRRNSIITEYQLKMALETQRDTLIQKGRAVRLGQLIEELGFASEADIIRTLNDEYQIDVNALTDDIRERLAKKYGASFEGLPRTRIPIWFQLAVATTFVIVLTIFTLTMAVLNQQKERLYEKTVNIGMVSINYFANNAAIPLLEDDTTRLNLLLREAAVVEGVRYALIVGPDQRIKAHTDVNLLGQPFRQFVENPQTTTKDQIIYYTYTRPDGSRLLDLYRPIKFKNTNLGEVHVGISLDVIDYLVKQERMKVVLITLVIIIIGIIVAVIYGYRFSMPILKIVKATQEFANGNYQHRIELRRNDELGTLGEAFNRMGQELWKNTMTQKSFGKYVGTEVLDMILANPETAWLKGTRNEATILIGDIRGFTTYANEKAPEQVVEALNEYLEIATATIIQFGGYVDKFIGDAVLGVFGVPVFRKDHVERAVRAARHLQETLERNNTQGNRLLAAVGISIHSGVVVAGNVGSQSKMEYTVIGDTVNMASRLNAFAGAGEIVVSRQVVDQAGGILNVQSLGPQMVKGKSDPVEVYKLIEIRKNATTD